jgi:outer membrane beta-barrel protein
MPRNIVFVAPFPAEVTMRFVRAVAKLHDVRLLGVVHTLPPGDEARVYDDVVRIDAPVFLYQAHLLWTIAYGKLRWFGSEIGRFDIRLAIGGGITDNQTARGLTGSAGIGASFFIGEWFAIRVDVRDQILEQSLLGESRIVNNLTATLGLSVFVPFEN